MATESETRRVPLLLWPFWAIWRLFALIIGLTGRLAAGVLGLLLMIAGLIVSFTLIGLPVGVPLIIIGFLLMIRSIF
jgi:hypothetical protein